MAAEFRRHGLARVSIVVALFALVAGASCGGSSGEEEGLGGDGTDTGGNDDAQPLDGFTIDVGDGGACAPPCLEGYFCWESRCVRDQPCTSDDTCQDDTWCDKTIGKCVPYGPPGKD